MKKILIFIIFLVLLQIALAETSLNQGESSIIEGREIKLVAAKENQVIISVDNEKSIFNEGETKEINGVKITVTEIFYASDLTSSVKFSAELTYVCGDNVCSSFENTENCCKDCKCEANKKCIENKCVIPECLKDDDCNDNNNLTEDKCSEYKCSFRQIKCKNNNECNDNNPDTDDTCSNGKCKNILNYVCKTNEDCNDDNKCTQDLCVNKDCQYKKVEDCKEEIKEVKEEVKKEEVKEGTVEKVGFFKKIINWFKNLFY